MGIFSKFASGVQKIFGTNEKSQGAGYYRDYLPDSMSYGNVIGGSGGVPNIKDLMESRGEISGLSKDYELGQIERSRASGQNRAQSSVFRAGLGKSGAAAGRYRAVDQTADLQRQESVARWRREAEQRRRDDISQIYLPYANQYLEAAWRRASGLAGAAQAATANRANTMKSYLDFAGKAIGGI